MKDLDEEPAEIRAIITVKGSFLAVPASACLRLAESIDETVAERANSSIVTCRWARSVTTRTSPSSKGSNPIDRVSAVVINGQAVGAPRPLGRIVRQRFPWARAPWATHRLAATKPFARVDVPSTFESPSRRHTLST
jgi:hypothetical protein